MHRSDVLSRLLDVGKLLAETCDKMEENFYGVCSHLRGGTSGFFGGKFIINPY